MFATVTILGRLGRDPEERTTDSGTQMVSISVATDRFNRGEKKTIWHKVLIFGRTSEFVAKHFFKGDPIIVSGELDLEEYTTKDGVRTKTIVVLAKSVGFAGYKEDQQQQQTETTAPRKEKAGTPVALYDEIPF